MTIMNTNVLIVDDQPDNLRTLSAMLTQHGYKVRNAVSGEIALETIRLKPPNLILLDIKMPQMDGYEVCSVLKQSPQTSDIPVIFLSVLDDTVDKAKAFSVGGADYITKPFHTEEVLFRIQNQIKIQQRQYQLQREIQERRCAEELLQLQLKRDQLLSTITSYVDQTVQLDEILEKAVVEIREILKIDRALIGQISSENNLKVISESVQSPEFSLLGQTFPIDCSKDNWQDWIQRNLISIIEDIHSDNTSENKIDSFTLPRVKASVVLPIQQSDEVWGVLMTDNCTTPRIWEEWEIELLQHLAVLLAIAIRQAHLYQAAQIQINDLHKLKQFKDDLLDVIFHELRAPIANIKLISCLLMVNTYQPSAIDTKTIDTKISTSEAQENKITHYLKMLQDECERELRLIQDLLDLHRLEAGIQSLNPAPIDLKYWIPHLTEPFELRIQHQQQTLCLQIESTLPLINTDAFYLSRVLTELVNNACKYTPAGGIITIRASAENGTVNLSVINTGVEIAAEECALIFNRFYRIDAHDVWKSGGTGLGLTLVKRLVDYLNGSIHVTSANQQTCFTVNLPIEALY